MFQCIFLIENFLILNEISLKYVPYGPVDNMAALVQIMAWRRTGDRPLSEPMLVCFIDAYMRHSTSMSQSAVTLHNCSVYRWTCVAQFLYEFLVTNCHLKFLNIMWPVLNFFTMRYKVLFWYSEFFVSGKQFYLVIRFTARITVGKRVNILSKGTPFSQDIQNIFSCMKMVLFWLKFPINLLPRSI